jgi:hypothetical protein
MDVKLHAFAAPALCAFTYGIWCTQAPGIKWTEAGLNSQFPHLSLFNNAFSTV